jgi:hypothetical protein
MRGSTFNPNRGEKAGETVREAISRRTLDGIATLVRDVEASNVPFDVGYRCLLIMVDVVQPFVTPDVRQTLDQTVSSWRDMARKQEENLARQQEQQGRFHQEIAPMRQLDEVVF